MGQYFMSLKKSTVYIGALLLPVLLMGNSQVQAQEQEQEVGENTGAEDEEETTIEEVVVFGIQKSLETALAEKREKTNLTEVINAEDIGKLPDENVAEVLENIPGVQITRNAGIGAAVSVRGSDQNRVEINGRGTTPSGDSRGGISFADLPAALVRSLNVVKVPTADMVEGSIGGTIDVKTYRGLKLKEPLIVGRFASEYAENADEWNENYSATLGKKFSTDYGDVGGIVTLSYIDKSVREDSLRVSPGIRRVTAFNGNPPSNQEFDGDGDNNDPYYFPGFGDLVYGDEERENAAFSGSLEWQVNPGLKLFAEGTYTDFERYQQQQSAFLGTPGSDKELDGLDDATFGFVTVAGIRVPVLTSGVIGGGIRNGRSDLPSDTGTPNDGLQIRTSNSSSVRETESFVTALGGEWQGGNLLAEFEVTAAKSESKDFAFRTTFQYNEPNSNPNVFHNANARVRIPFFFDSRGGDLAYGPVPGAAGAANLLNPDYYSLLVARDTENNFDNSEYTQKVDFTYTLDEGFFSSLKFGIRLSQRSNERNRKSQSTQQFPGRTNTAGVAQLTQFLVPTPGDFFDFNSGGSYLDNFLTLDGSISQNQRPLLRDLLNLQTDGLVDPLQGFKVEENTEAIYLRADFDTEILGVPMRGNFGYRLIRTDQLASGNEVLGDGSLNAVSERQVYSNLLPSLSLVMSPVEKIQVRLGFAEILRRPNFGDLSPTVQFPLNESQAVQVGDPRLRPTSANQYDLAFEYYFRKGSVFSLGYYYKDLKSVIGSDLRFESICNPRVVGSPLENPPCTVNGVDGRLVNRISPVNLEGGRIQGFEVALQHNFNWLPLPWRGLGVIANYAYQDGDRDDTFGVPGFLQDDGVSDAEFPLNFQRLSEDSYNFTVYFERPRYRWSGRLRYTYRDGFLSTESSDISNGQPLYTDDRGQLNGSMSYKLSDVFTLTFSGVNLTKETREQRAAFEGGPLVKQFDSDRRLSLGLRGRF